MLVTKAGIRKRGRDQGSYRNFVWLGRPANVASKLTDTANKPSVGEYVTTVRVAYDKPALPTFGALGLGFSRLPVSNPFSFAEAILGVGGPATNLLSSTTTTDWEWVSETPSAFLAQLKVQYAPTRITHEKPNFGSFFLHDEYVTKAGTPPILMTAAVWAGFRKSKPDSPSVTQALFKESDVKVPGYTDKVFGGRAIYPELKP